MVETVQGPLDELTETLIVASGFLSNLRRLARTSGTSTADLQALEEAFARSIVLTRTLRERVQTLRSCPSRLGER
jgi:hypothetical protein